MPQFESQYFISQIFWFSICFAIIYFTVSKIYLPKIKSILQQRSKENYGEQSDLDNLKIEIENLKKSEQKLRDDSAEKYKNITDKISLKIKYIKEKSDEDAIKNISSLNKKATTVINKFLENQSPQNKIIIDKLKNNISKKLLNH